MFQFHISVSPLRAFENRHLTWSPQVVFIKYADIYSRVHTSAFCLIVTWNSVEFRSSGDSGEEVTAASFWWENSIFIGS